MLGLIDFILAAALIGSIVWVGYQANTRFAGMGYFTIRKVGKARKKHLITKSRVVAIVGLAVTAVFVGGMGMVYLLFNSPC